MSFVRVGLLLLELLLHLGSKVVEVICFGNIIASKFAVLVIKFVYVCDHQINYTVKLIKLTYLLHFVIGSELAMTANLSAAYWTNALPKRMRVIITHIDCSVQCNCGRTCVNTDEQFAGCRKRLRRFDKAGSRL